MTTPVKINRSATSVLLAAAIAAALIACAPPAPTPSISPAPAASPAPTPTTTASAAVVLSPQPIIDVTCAEVLADSTVAAQFAVPVVPADAAISMMMASSTSMASAYSVRSLGGLACEWNNGESYSSSRGTNLAYVGYRVLVLPGAVSQWARYIDLYGPEGAGQYCGSGIGSGVISCGSNDLVGDRWIEIETFGVISEGAATALRTSVVDAVSAAAPVAQVWTAPAGTLPLPPDCGGLVPSSIVASAVGSTVPITSSRAGGGGWSLDAGANVNAAVVACYWFFEGSELGPGAIRSLGTGAWAWNEARPALTAPGTPETLPIAGLDGSDQAWIRCAPANMECVVDLVVGGNWIEFFVTQDIGAGVFIDPRAAATTIAEGVVATLRS